MPFGKKGFNWRGTSIDLSLNGRSSIGFFADAVFARNWITDFRPSPHIRLDGCYYAKFYQHRYTPGLIGWLNYDSFSDPWINLPRLFEWTTHRPKVMAAATEYRGDKDQVLKDKHSVCEVPQAIVGCPNRLLALARFLDSQYQSRFSHAWWRSIFNEKGVIQACQLRPIGISTTS